MWFITCAYSIDLTRQRFRIVRKSRSNVYSILYAYIILSKFKSSMAQYYVFYCLLLLYYYYHVIRLQGLKLNVHNYMYTFKRICDRCVSTNNKSFAIGNSVWLKYLLITALSRSTKKTFSRKSWRNVSLYL